MSLLAWAADRVLCASEAVRLSNFHDVRRFKDRVLTLYDWHEENMSGKRHEWPPNSFEQFGIDPSARVVLMPARMEPWKGQHVLVEAAPEILGAIPDAVILFVGDVVKGRGREGYPGQSASHPGKGSVCKSFFLPGTSRTWMCSCEPRVWLLTALLFSEPFGLDRA